MTHILLVGSGSREHALAKAMKTAPTHCDVYCISNVTNPGIKSLCTQYHIADPNNPQVVADYAKNHAIDLAVIGPEAPLEAGVADALKSVGIKVVGPTKNHAQLESSKGFTRNLIEKYGIDGNPFYKRFTSMQGVCETLQTYAERFVIKADGLCGGKGVVVWGDHLHTMDEAINHCQSLVNQGVAFVIEEKVIGQEFSLISLSDGTTLLHTPAIQDHKRAFVGDTGPNTGGMGTYSDANHSLPFLSVQDCITAQRINQQVNDALKQEFGTPYQGILYGGFMATADGVKVIEYNARFGDPEAMNILTLFEGDFVKTMFAISDETLHTLDIAFKSQATVCKYVVPNGYPNQSQKGFSVDISAVPDTVHMFMGSVDDVDGTLIAMGSRTIAVLGVADTICEAEQKAEHAIKTIKGDLFHRPDIGTSALINKRIAHMNTLRGDGTYKKV